MVAPGSRLLYPALEGIANGSQRGLVSIVGSPSFSDEMNQKSATLTAAEKSSGPTSSCQSNNNRERKRHLPASPSTTTRCLDTNTRSSRKVNTAFTLELLCWSGRQHGSGGTGCTRRDRKSVV